MYKMHLPHPHKIGQEKKESIAGDFTKLSSIITYLSQTKKSYVKTKETVINAFFRFIIILIT